ncbi:cysteine hydrolase family protein [Microbacterium candidum]|uniref:Cysteine hydrolase family protein n=1 Tax=Microbacterium candidum TaxID=3041922 RepID=A0ABT7MYF5_9MICO|nr:cysteine hydrolase family protein [Microbacterium sp. ASV49]MDL9979457.1 cysteine hydrolase family protein [Microbacterium sp. ASV49]
MATLENRDGTALLVVDVQNDVVGGAYERDAVVGRIAGLVDRAREAGVPVVWVQHNDPELVRGTEGWALVPELVPAEGEAHVDKQYGDSFEGTDLEEILAGLGVDRLIVAGAETDACIRSTIHGAFVRGYDTTLVSDAHTAGDKTAWGAPPVPDVIAHTNLYWQFQGGPGKTAAVVKAADVDLG